MSVSCDMGIVIYGLHPLFGNGRFLLRQLDGAQTEMALAVQACHLKRAINVLGARRLLTLLA